MALKKEDKEKKGNEAKTKEKQKKLKEMRLHPGQSTPFVQPTVDQALLAAAIAQAQAMVKRYPEPMAHGPEACEPSHPLWPMAQRPASRHTRAEAVDTGCPCSLTREIWNPISNQ